MKNKYTNLISTCTKKLIVITVERKIPKNFDIINQYAKYLNLKFIQFADHDLCINTGYLIFFQLQPYQTHNYHKVVSEKHVGTMHSIITYYCALFYSGTQQNILRSIAKFAL